MGVNVQSDRWTGSILRSSSYDLIDRHWFLWRYLVVFKVSFRDEVVTPGVTPTSVLTSAECQRHTSSIWPWSGVPKVRLYDTFLGGLRQSRSPFSLLHKYAAFIRLMNLPNLTWIKLHAFPLFDVAFTTWTMLSIWSNVSRCVGTDTEFSGWINFVWEKWNAWPDHCLGSM